MDFTADSNGADALIKGDNKQNGNPSGIKQRRASAPLSVPAPAAAAGGAAGGAAGSRPWRKPRRAVQEERRATQEALAGPSSSSFSSSSSHDRQRLNARAIVFCYEADALLDNLDGSGASPAGSPLGGSTAPAAAAAAAAARAAVQSFRQASTNDRAGDKEHVEAARATAASALRGLGLESGMRAALAVRPAGKWPLMHEVIPGLWCGGWAALGDSCRALSERGITRVVSVVSADKRLLPESIISEHLHIHAHDDKDANLLKHFPRIVEFVGRGLREKTGVYLHCGAGVSRAPTSTAAYIMWRYKLPAAEALAIVRKARPATRPNLNFVSQLKEWERQIDGCHGSATATAACPCPCPCPAAAAPPLSADSGNSRGNSNRNISSTSSSNDGGTAGITAEEGGEASH
jgi:protein-tyrosine phosphatase